MSTLNNTHFDPINPVFKTVSIQHEDATTAGLHFDGDIAHINDDMKITGNLTVTGTINGTLGGGDFVKKDGTNTGTINIGNTTANAMNFKTNSITALTINDTQMVDVTNNLQVGGDLNVLTGNTTLGDTVRYNLL